MTITYLKRAEIDLSKWEQCVNSHAVTAIVFGQHWFLDNCCTTWHAFVVDDYRAVLPLPVRKKFGITYVYPPFWAFRLGFFGEELTQNEIDEVFDCAAKKFRWADLFFSSDIQYKKGNIFPHKTYMLDLQEDYYAIRRNYHESHRRNCKKGQTENLEIVFDAKPQEIIDLFRNNRGKDVSVSYKESDYADLLRITALLQERKSIEIVGVRNAEGVLCAGAFFAFWEKKYHFLFSGRSADKQSRSLYFLIDDFIFRHAGKDLSLDFNGSNNPDIARFYAGFGAKEKTFNQLIISRLNKIQRLALLLKRRRQQNNSRQIPFTYK
ncbi:MAG: GNAT family N-acetyltransferase [Lentimicrobiaceae bacterium]|nr:GNAT family N-acetyltransferase [Lentimicrobiaceae bacterium]